MIRFDHIDLQRITVSAIGAALLSATCLVAAVAPAKAASVNAPQTVQDWRANVEHQIDATLRLPEHALGSRDHAIVTVAITLGQDGRVAGVAILHSAGSEQLDREALRTARTVSYPALPVGLRGRQQIIAMQLFFGASASSGNEQAVAAMTAAADQAAKAHDTQSAALPTG